MNTTRRKFILIPLAVLFIWAVAFAIGFGILGTLPNEMQFLGQFGDMFGSLNTLFSGLAMSGALYAIILQMEQIQEQANQIQAQRNHDAEMVRKEKFEQLMGAIDRVILEAQAIVRDVKDLTKIEKNDERYLQVREYYTDAELLAALYFPTLVEKLHKLSPFGLSTVIASVVKAKYEGYEVDGFLDDGRQIWRSFYVFRADAIEQIDAHIKFPTAEIRNAPL